MKYQTCGVKDSSNLRQAWSHHGGMRCDEFLPRYHSQDGIWHDTTGNLVPFVGFLGRRYDTNIT